MSGPTFPELVERYLQDLGVRKPSPHTLAAYRRDLLGVGRRIADATGPGAGAEAAGEDGPGGVGRLTLGDLDKRALRAGFASWADDHAASSIRRAWSAWSSFFDFLVAEDLADANPMSAVTPPKASRSRAKVIRGRDVAPRLLEAAATPDETARHPWPERDVALVATFIVTGVRLSEAISLAIGAFEGPDGARRLVVTGKGDKTRTIPIEAPYEAVVERYLRTRAERFPRHELDHPATPLFVRADTGTPPSRQQVQHWIDKLYRRAGVRAQVPPGALVHALRHTFATSALDHGVDVVELQELLGHASLETTRRYLEATGARLREAVAAHPAQATLRDFAGRDTPS
ncbi:MAG: tyrosine-type recombinase/integrase [Actinomycetota bacterium]|nr:tyrosine-type recombinase/integrase [Actinomycetota bacterium]